MPKTRITSRERNFAASQVETAKDEGYSRKTKLMSGVAIAGSLFAGIGLSPNSPVAGADKCYVVGGATDGNGEMLKGTLAQQGQLAGCNEGVETIPYPAEIGPFVGQMRMEDSVAIGVADLTNRLNNTSPNQRKRIMSFSEGTEVALQSVNQSTAVNIDNQMNGGPQGRTGVYKHIVADNPIVKPIVRDLIGIPTDTPIVERPGVETTRRYSKGDFYANAQPQGLDPFALISMADVSIRAGQHRVPDPHEIPVADFVDGDGIRNVVYDDGSPFTRVGDANGSVMNPNPGPEIPALFYGLPPVGGNEIPKLQAPNFFGETPCNDGNGDYWTPNGMPCANEAPAPAPAPAPEVQNFAAPAPFEAPAPAPVFEAPAPAPAAAPERFPGQVSGNIFEPPCFAEDGSQYWTAPGQPC